MSTTDSILLDCSERDSAEIACAAILKIEVLELRNYLHEIELSCKRDITEEQLYDLVLSRFSNDLCSFNAVFHHATRTTDLESFTARGILCRSAIYNEVYEYLKQLSNGMVSHGDYLNSFSSQSKREGNDEGPFGYFIKGFIFSDSNDDHKYLDAPEMICDISGQLLGGNYLSLVEKYKEISKPCIVSFSAPGKDIWLSRAIWYLYRCLAWPDEGEVFYGLSFAENMKGSVSSTNILNVVRIT